MKKICLTCKKEIEFIKYKSERERKFCSLKCFYIFNRGKNNSSSREEVKMKIGEGNKGHIPWNVGIPCSNGTKEKMRKKLIGKKHSEEAKLKMRGRTPWNKNLTKENSSIIKSCAEMRVGKHLSEEWRKNISKARLFSYKEKNMVNPMKDKKRPDLTKRNLENNPGKSNDPLVKEKISKSSKKRWNNADYRERTLKAQWAAMQIRPTNPEKIMIKLIKENNLPFNYVGNGTIWFRGETMSFNPDFLSKNPKHIIEVFGDYWHNREDAKIRDKQRLETYNRNSKQS